MKIDPKIEEPLRRAYVAVVDEKLDGIPVALESLDQKQSKTLLVYAVFVVRYVVNDVHPEPDAEASEVMAEHVFADVSKWSPIDTRDEVSSFLLACAIGDTSYEGVQTDKIFMYALVLGGTLLAWYSPEGMRWFEYLDQIWNFFESQPDPA